MVIGFLLDLILGDPQGWPHIVRGYGKLIDFLEDKLYKAENKKRAGAWLVICVLLFVTVTTAAVEVFSFLIHPVLYLMIDGILCWQCLALKSLRDETQKVFLALRQQDLDKARNALSMVVGRDTKNLDEEGIIRACVETIAENTSDGIGAPLMYMGIGTGVLSCIYKAINTMDSMIGYQNDRYREFGFAAAKLDDFANYIPARLTALSMLVAAFVCKLDYKNAWAVFKRDRYKHASPNSAQTEAVMAGALQVQLAGDAWYFGQRHKKEYIGDPIRKIEASDITKAHRMMEVTSYILFFGMMIWEAVWILIIMAVK